MKKNVASQKIGAQMVSATDGSAFTGAVTVEVTIDAGTQATGSVGSGACTHEGNGYHTYAPSQAETNGDLLAFTFHGTGAVPVTVQVFTTFPQTGDNFARLGAPAGASVSADVAAIKSDTAAVKAKTDNLPSDPADASDIAGAFSTVNSTLSTLTGYVDTEVAAIKAKTDNLPAAPAATGDCITAAGVRTAVGLASANLDTQLDALPTNAELATALAGADDATLAAISALVIPTANQNAAALLDLAAGVETGLTLRQALRLLVAAEAGKLSGAASTTITIRNYGDSKDRIVATVDDDGNRSALTYDLT